MCGREERASRCCRRTCGEYAGLARERYLFGVRRDGDGDDAETHANMDSSEGIRSWETRRGVWGEV
jgi:hypothetical protein